MQVILLLILIYIHALIGRLPENDNEVLIQFSFTDEEMKYLEKNVLDKTIDFSSGDQISKIYSQFKGCWHKSN